MVEPMIWAEGCPPDFGELEAMSQRSSQLSGSRPTDTPPTDTDPHHPAMHGTSEFINQPSPPCPPS